MKREAALKVALLTTCVIATSYSVANATPPTLDVIRTEDGVPAKLYVSQHRLECGNHVFELVVDSSSPVKVTELKVDGLAIPATQLNAINTQVPERSWFESILTSCTSNRQALNLRLSAPEGRVIIPLSFKDGALVTVGTRDR